VIAGREGRLDDLFAVEVYLLIKSIYHILTKSIYDNRH